MIDGVDVYSYGFEEPVGSARFNLRHGEISTVFSYSEAYRKSPDSYAIEPQTPLSQSRFFYEGLPPIFRDASPDRWGRRLLQKAAEESEDSSDSIAYRKLDEVDYLLGSLDITRQGALRFKELNGDRFLDSSRLLPSAIDLKELRDASRSLSQDENSHEVIKQLLNVGTTSLGGARPKAGVVDEGKLLLAKFSHENDDWNVIAWEKTALDMAKLAGIKTPNCELVSLGNDDVLVQERFDREGSNIKGARIPYMSGMTLLNTKEGQSHDYFEVIEQLLYETESEEEIYEMFRRIAFSIAIHNTDDHLRNHGLVRLACRWGLSPVFDINPNPDIDEHRVLSIDGRIGGSEAAGLKSLVDAFGLEEKKASKIVADVLQSVDRYDFFARKYKISQNERKMMGSVFKVKAKELSEFFDI